MSFQTDRRVAQEAERWFGEYLVTFISERGQVRADLFRKGGVVIAHVSFPTGIDAGRVTDPYISELENYARDNGFADHFSVILS